MEVACISILMNLKYLNTKRNVFVYVAIVGKEKIKQLKSKDGKIGFIHFLSTFNLR